MNNKYDKTEVLQVYNRTHYDIGITLSTGMQPVIRAGSFFPLSVMDILYIESVASRSKPFSSKLLVVEDDNHNDLSLEDLGGFTDPYVEKHFDAEEISANLNKSAKHIAEWLKNIEDHIELDAIRDMADKMDLPGSKLKVIQAKIPNRNMLESEEE